MRADQASGPPHRLPNRPPRRARGLSLVELMIGMVLGLVVSLAAVSSLRTFTAGQRQGMATGSGMVSASGALGMIKNDVAAAGLGFFDGRAPMCNRMNLSLGTGALINGTAFAPVQITRALNQDQLDLLYATDVAAGVSLPLSANSDGASSQTLSTLPVNVGQAVLLAPANTGLCTLRTVTAVTAGTVTTPQVLAFGGTGKHNQKVFTTAPSYAKAERVSMVGTLLWHRYRVQDGNLVLEQPLEGRTAVLVRQVVAMRVNYGVANAGTSTLANWRDATEAGWGALDITNIGQVRAVRLGLLVRSTQREKADTDGVCRASTDKPTLFGQTIEPDVSDWRCFRFRSSTVVVPLRNLVWGQQP